MADTARQMVKDSGLPSGIQDKVNSFIDKWQQENTRGGVPCECQEKCDSLHHAMNGGEGASSASGNDDMENSAVQTALDQLGESCSEGEGKSGKGNWLVVLAQALGKQAGKHLKEMVKLGNEMGSMDSKEKPEDFAEKQSMFQAESKMFGMFQEAVSTMIKSIGEGMSSVARKQ
jgi:hypothetical protein